MNIVHRIAIIMLLTLTVATSAYAEETYLKYRDVFYPDGMPVISHTDSKGVTKNYQTEYVFYGELDIPDTSLKVVAFSKIDAMYTYSDNRHYLFISVIQQSENGWDIVYRKDISDYIYPSSGSEKGYVGSINCILDYYNLENFDAVHLDIYADLTGTGKYGGSSDVIFFMQNNELVPVIKFLASCATGSSGSEMSSNRYSGVDYTFINMADIDSDGSVEILKQFYEREIEDGIVIRDEFIDDISVYKFNNEENRYKYDGKITTLPSDAVELRRYYVPTVPAQGCCP